MGSRPLVRSTTTENPKSTTQGLRACSISPDYVLVFDGYDARFQSDRLLAYTGIRNVVLQSWSAMAIGGDGMKTKHP